MAWRERKQTEKGKGRVNKAMLPTRWQRVSTEGAGGLRLRPQSVPISQDRSSHGVVLDPQHPHLGTCLEMLVFWIPRRKRWRWGLALVILTSSPGASEAPGEERVEERDGG